MEGIPTEEALSKYDSVLTPYEKDEIKNFPLIYYAGQKCEEKIKAPTGDANDGYDNESGEYNIVPRDHIAYRYEVVGLLGSGAFGQVVKAVDYKEDDFVAIKIIRNRRKIAFQSKAEIRILQDIRDKDEEGSYGLVQMIDNFTFRGHVCIVYELLGMDLYDVMKKGNFYPMPLSTVKQIAARVLVSLAFLWKEGIVHCDLKPENILLKSEEGVAVKVVDLGSACYESGCSYTYIQSRFYRAPEVVLSLEYGCPIDLWSFGCILCELATGNPIFAGESEHDQLFCIMEYLGMPPEDMVMRSKRRAEFFNEDMTPKITPNDKGKVREVGSKTIASFIGVAENSLFASFVSDLLQWDPEKRANPTEAMKHPWIEDEFVFKANDSSEEEDDEAVEAVEAGDGEEDPTDDEVSKQGATAEHSHPPPHASGSAPTDVAPSSAPVTAAPPSRPAPATHRPAPHGATTTAAPTAAVGTKAAAPVASAARTAPATAGNGPTREARGTGTTVPGAASTQRPAATTASSAASKTATAPRTDTVNKTESSAPSADSSNVNDRVKFFNAMLEKRKSIQQQKAALSVSSGGHAASSGASTHNDRNVKESVALPAVHTANGSTTVPTANAEADGHRRLSRPANTKATRERQNQAAVLPGT